MDDTWLCPQENPPKAAWRCRFPPHSKGHACFRERHPNEPVSRDSMIEIP